MVSVLVGQRVDKEVSPYIATGVDTRLTEATEKDVKIRVGFLEVQRSA